MNLRQIPGEFSICQLRQVSGVDFTDQFCFLSKTDEEISLVCRKGKVPADAIRRNDGWRAFCIEGELDFSLIGILSAISGILAANSIGIFAVSTYNTDYIFTKGQDFGKAMDVLQEAGYTIS